MTGPEYDAELEAFLKRRSPMHRRLSDIDNAEPSIELDRLVLNRARDAIDTPTQPLFRSSRWALSVGLAATILIAFTVVLNIDHHGANGARPVASNVSPATEAPVARAATVAKRYAMPEPQDAASADSAHLIASSSALRAQAPPPAAPPVPSGAAARGGVMPAAPATALAASPNLAAPAAASSPGAAPDPHSSPDSWLREINRLRAAGRIADADRELAAFREAYPTHPAYAVAKPPTR